MILLLDLILLIVLIGFGLLGYFLGLFQAVGAVLGLIFASWAAKAMHRPVGNWLKPLFSGYCNLIKIVVFSSILILINRLFGFSFYLVGKKSQLIRSFLFLKKIDRIGGLILGLFEGVIIIGLVLFVASHYLGDYEWFNKILMDSKIASDFIELVNDLKLFSPQLNKI